MKTIFFEARKLSKLSRETLSIISGISLNRIKNIENDMGLPVTIEEILLINQKLENEIIRDYFVSVLKEGRLNLYMPKRVKESTDLELYIALKSPIMLIPHIATALSCSTALARIAYEDLKEFAVKEMKLKLPPAGGIQSIVFETMYGFTYHRYENSFEVLEYRRDKGEPV